MSEYIRNNPMMRSIEERHKQDEEVALRAEDLKLVKPLVGTLKDEMELEVALQQIIYNLCDNVKVITVKCVLAWQSCVKAVPVISLFSLKKCCMGIFSIQCRYTEHGRI